MTQTHMMFSRDGVFTGGAAVYSALWPEATLTLTASPPHHNVDQEDLVLSAQSWAPLPFFQKCHLTWALDSKALKQSDLGFLTRLHLSAGVWADTRTDSSN